MVFWDKKGDMDYKLVAILITLLVVGVLLGLTQKIFATSEKVLEGKDCQASLGLQKLGDAVPLVTLENTCQTILVELPQNYKRYTDVEQVQKEIGGKIARTWDIVHKGTLEDLWNEDGFQLFTTNGCLVMYQIDIEKLPTEEITFLDLETFLVETHFAEIDGISYKYWDYIQKDGRGAFALMVEEGKSLSTQKLEVGEQYAISVVSKEKAIADNFFNTAEKPATGVVFSTLDHAQNTMKCDVR